MYKTLRHKYCIHGIRTYFPTMKKIFFIDDDIDDRDLFRDALQELDVETEYVEAFDGQHALDMIARPDFTPPDLIFVDLNMPRINGLEFVIRVKQISGYENIPVYIYTTSASPHERVNCVTAGATGYIIKHVRYSDLAKELQALITKNSQPA